MNKKIDKIIRYVYNEFGNEFGDIIVDLKHQLQAYKDKEDKLREYLTNTEFEERTAYDTSFCEGVYNTKEKALRILNEGDK